MKAGQKAQSSLEYLMTYGWALVLVASLIAVLVFIISSPVSTAFSSSDPTKIMAKGGSVIGENAEIKLQNITGGEIEITTVTLTDNYSVANCTLNGETLPPTSNILVTAGGEIHLECDSVTGNGSGTISIDYTDHAGLQRSAGVTVSVSGTPVETGPPCLSGGEGTEEDPIMVTSLAELDNVRNEPALYYAMCQDIDISETSSWNEDGLNPGIYFGFPP